MTLSSWNRAVKHAAEESSKLDSSILETIEISGNNYESHERYLAAIQESYF